MINLVDSHAHLTFEDFEEDRDEIITEAKEGDIEYILTVGNGPEDTKEAIDLAENHEFIYASAGLHPHIADRMDEDLIEDLRDLAGHRKVIALGETGLDYHYDNSPRDVQRKAFRNQIELARETDLPLIIHSREAAEDTLAIIRETDVGEIGGVIHCFSYDKETMFEFIGEGFLVSFTGTLTFPNANSLREAASALPYERILLETDCPYLAPQPVRGKRNKPVYVKYIAETLTGLLPLTYEDVCRITTANFERLYGLEEKKEGAITYEIRNSLYLNITNECTNDCDFCVRGFSDGVAGYNLKLDRVPSGEEILEEIDDPGDYEEIVFCGFGEPTTRFETIKKVSERLKERGARIRLTTNGHGNIINGENILRELDGLVDKIAVSLNASNSDEYKRFCNPQFEDIDVFEEVLEFVREAKTYIPEVEITCVDIPDLDLKKCRKLAKDLGVDFRKRDYNVVG